MLRFKTNVQSIAKTDASKWAYAEMFFGEGAGTRRKLLRAEINEKMRLLPGYEKALQDALNKENLAKHAMKAAKERKRLDRSKSLTRNVRGLITGNVQSLTTTIGVIFTVWTFAHQTGMDKDIYEWAKPRVIKTKNRLKSWWSGFKAETAAERLQKPPRSQD